MSSGNNEQTFTTQPHPAKDNNPTPGGGGGAGFTGGSGNNTSGDALNPMNASNAHPMAQPGPRILDQSTAQGLEKPKTREELKEAAKSLNA